MNPPQHSVTSRKLRLHSLSKRPCELEAPGTHSHGTCMHACVCLCVFVCLCEVVVDVSHITEESFGPHPHILTNSHCTCRRRKTGGDRKRLLGWMRECFNRYFKILPIMNVSAV